MTCEEHEGRRTGRVQFGAVTQPVRLDFVPQVQAGDYVLVHVGFAITRVDAEEAERTYRLLEGAGYLSEAARFAPAEAAAEAVEFKRAS